MQYCGELMFLHWHGSIFFKIKRNGKKRKKKKKKTVQGEIRT